jgi:hypothetical protein
MNVMPHTFICVYSYFPMIWYVKIRVVFFSQFSYKSLPKFPLKFRQSLPYIGKSQVIDTYPVYTFNILHLITASRPNHPGSQCHKHNHHHHNHNIYNIHWQQISL